MAKVRSQTALTNVFVNCPFDRTYKPLFDAIIFSIHDLGFKARHSLIDDSEAVRLTRIAKEIAGCKYSIHDISRVESTGSLALPRFNMPFEAGIAYCHYYLGTRSNQHHFLLLDSKPYRYQASLSDAAGLDPKIHEEKPEKVVGAVRTFLAQKSGQSIPGASHILGRYKLFSALLPEAAKSQQITLAELRSLEYVNDLQAIMVRWISNNPP